MTPAGARALLSWLLLSSLGGCFPYQPGDAQFSCAETGLCPHGYVCTREAECRVPDGKCVMTDATPPSVDAVVSGGQEQPTRFDHADQTNPIDVACLAGGGFNIWTSVQAGGMDLSEVAVTVALLAGAKAYGGSETLPLDLTQGEGIGIMVFVGNTSGTLSDISDQLGPPLTVNVTAEDTCGNAASFTTQIVLEQQCSR